MPGDEAQLTRPDGTRIITTADVPRILERHTPGPPGKDRRPICLGCPDGRSIDACAERQEAIRVFSATAPHRVHYGEQKAS